MEIMPRYISKIHTSFNKKGRCLYFVGGDYNGYRANFDVFRSVWVLQRKIWIFGWIDCYSDSSLLSASQAMEYGSIKDLIFFLGIKYRRI